MSSSSNTPSPPAIGPIGASATNNSNGSSSPNSNSSPNNNNNNDIDAVDPPLIPALITLTSQIISIVLTTITVSSCVFLLLLSSLFLLPLSRPFHSRSVSNIHNLLLSSLSISLPSTPLHLTTNSSPLGNIGRNIVVCNYTSCRDVFLLLILTRYLVQSEVRILGSFQQKDTPTPENKYFTSEYYLQLLAYLLDIPLLSSTRIKMEDTLANVPEDVTLLLFPEGLSRPSPTLEKHYAQTSARKTFTNLGLPRTKGFNTLMSLTHESPITCSIYSLALCTSSPPLSRTFSLKSTLQSFKSLIRPSHNHEILVSIKSHTLAASTTHNFLDLTWSEMDRTYTKYLRGEIREYRTFDSRTYDTLSGLISLLRLSCALFLSPLICLVLFPVGYTVFIFNVSRELYRMYLLESSLPPNSDLVEDEGGRSVRTESNFTPYFPSTPFASPLSLGGWGRKDVKKE
ncbi:hypothetical protein TrST_g7356 [Triparma strigata]|uniref:Uncharacterized protein n=1 Tax=Triparma strigata TaxID=1606541 RepID=A0A9W7BJ58_9STRA|nr:hypothetical protein TrST_g7356 [Triparma strigata]